MKKSIFLAAATFVALTQFANADIRQPAEATIEFTTEEFATEAGRTALRNRVVRAAEQACKVQAADSAIPQIDRECVADLIAKAETEIADKRAVTLSKLITAGQPSFR